MCFFQQKLTIHHHTPLPPVFLKPLCSLLHSAVVVLGCGLSEYSPTPNLTGVLTGALGKHVLFTLNSTLVVVSNVFVFSHLPGEMIQFDEHIFQVGRSHQLATSHTSFKLLRLDLEGFWLITCMQESLEEVAGRLRYRRCLHWCRVS